MPTKLKPLLLPQLVEARRSEEKDTTAARASTGSQSGSEVPSPVTPTFSLRALVRHGSPASSVELPPAAVFPRAGGASPPHASTLAGDAFAASRR